MNIVDPIDAVVSMLISIIVFSVTRSIPMDDWSRVVFVVCVYVALLILRQIHRLGGFENLSIHLSGFRKNAYADEIRLPDMPIDAYAELLSEAIEAIHFLPLRHHWLHKACQLLECELDQITVVRPAAILDECATK